MSYRLKIENLIQSLLHQLQSLQTDYLMEKKNPPEWVFPLRRQLYQTLEDLRLERHSKGSVFDPQVVAQVKKGSHQPVQAEVEAQVEVLEPGQAQVQAQELRKTE